MCEFYQANISEDCQIVQELFTEYLQWAFDYLTQKLGVELDVQAKVAEDMAHLEMFLPPAGRLVLTTVDSEVAGVGGLRTIGERMGEIKRMYVRPQFRRRGLGRKLLSHLVEQSVSMGNTVLRLDSAWFMETAHALYHSFGFREIAPYPESEVPKEIQYLWVFMEKDLTAQA